MKKIIFSVLILILITTGCGFKVLNQANLINFSIEEIKFTGDSRINYNLKNKINSFFYNANKKKIILIIDTKKNKTIKEKNIKNEITKYEVTIVCSIELAFLEKNAKHKFSVSSNGDYLAADKYSTTIQNEKRLIEDLTNDLSDKIKNKINLINNDL